MDGVVGLLPAHAQVLSTRVAAKPVFPLGYGVGLRLRGARSGVVAVSCARADRRVEARWGRVA
jgi:hypothetical protein